MRNIVRAFRNNRLLKSLTGMSKTEFNLLVPIFDQAIYYSKVCKPRKRAVGGGQKGALVSVEEKLFFTLLYLKIYPTCDFGGFIFDVDRSRICKWVQHFMPLLEKALGRSVTLPKRKISSMKELLELVPEAKDLFIDGTERETVKPKNSKLKRKRYSGKKKRHTRKNTIVCDENKKIIFVSSTREGKLHDLKQLKKTGVLRPHTTQISLWVDKGYTGIRKCLKHNNQVMIPSKKPRKKTMSPQQRKENKIVSGIRMLVEHAIGEIKRFSAMSNIYRNKKGQDDTMISLCAGLWNFHLQHKDI